VVDPPVVDPPVVAPPVEPPVVEPPVADPLGAGCVVAPEEPEEGAGAVLLAAGALPPLLPPVFAGAEVVVSEVGPGPVERPPV
jgi:hypothetical protein